MSNEANKDNLIRVRRCPYCDAECVKLGRALQWERIPKRMIVEVQRFRCKSCHKLNYQRVRALVVADGIEFKEF